jgi:hypothetical protein
MSKNTCFDPANVYVSTSESSTWRRYRHGRRKHLDALVFSWQASLCSSFSSASNFCYYSKAESWHLWESCANLFLYSIFFFSDLNCFDKPLLHFRSIDSTSCESPSPILWPCPEPPEFRYEAEVNFVEQVICRLSRKARSFPNNIGGKMIKIFGVLDIKKVDEIDTFLLFECFFGDTSLVWLVVLRRLTCESFEACKYFFHKTNLQFSQSKRVLEHKEPKKQTFKLNCKFVFIKIATANLSGLFWIVTSCPINVDRFWLDEDPLNRDLTGTPRFVLIPDDVWCVDAFQFCAWPKKWASMVDFNVITGKY